MSEPAPAPAPAPRCDICLLRPVIGVVSSGIVPMSFGICLECLTNGAEHLLVMLHLKLDVAQGDRDELHPDAMKLVTFYKGRYVTLGEIWDELEMTAPSCCNEEQTDD